MRVSDRAAKENHVSMLLTNSAAEPKNLITKDWSAAEGGARLPTLPAVRDGKLSQGSRLVFAGEDFALVGGFSPSGRLVFGVMTGFLLGRLSLLSLSSLLAGKAILAFVALASCWQGRSCSCCPRFLAVLAPLVGRC